MSWTNHRGPQHQQLLAPPEDGVALSSHPPGWLGVRWRSLLDRVGKDAQDRVLRGRNYARRGRLRALTVSPGCGSAECYCEDIFHPSLRVRPFSKQEWSSILHELTEDLNLIASLLEGELPSALVERLEGRGIRLMPVLDELSFDCDCGDYVMPCTHVSTVFHTLTDVLDGDPFLLLTLRGRDREQLLAQLRSDWGDEAPLARVLDDGEDAVPDGDWFVATGGVPDFGCTFGRDVETGAGLRALGPPPGEADLLGTLLPLYEGAARRVREVLDSVPDRVPPKRLPRVVEVRAVAEPPRVVEAAASRRVDPAPPSEPAYVPVAVGNPLTEALVELLAGEPGLTSTSIAERLRSSVSPVRAELVAMEELGLVLREADGDTVRWYLG